MLRPSWNVASSPCFFDAVPWAPSAWFKPVGLFYIVRSGVNNSLFLKGQTTLKFINEFYPPKIKEIQWADGICLTRICSAKMSIWGYFVMHCTGNSFLIQNVLLLIQIRFSFFFLQLWTLKKYLKESATIIWFALPPDTRISLPPSLNVAH